MKKRSAELKISFDEQGRPDKIVARSTKHFEALMASAKAGEFKVSAMEQGGKLGLWILEVSYPQPKQAVMFE
jgi:hypothetical protein